MERRKLIAGLGSVCIGGIAGCAESRTEPTGPPGERGTQTAAADSPDSAGTRTPTDSGTDGFVRPTGDPEAVPREWQCPNTEFTRHPVNYEAVEWGDTAGVALRVSDTDFEYGDTARITLTNVSERYVSTGTETDWGLEIHTDDGWQEVRGKVDSEAFTDTDLGADIPPGEGFEWTIALTEDGIVRPTPELVVCPDLVAGRYRFVYWGIEPAVAVAFDLAREASSGG